MIKLPPYGDWCREKNKQKKDITVQTSPHANTLDAVVPVDLWRVQLQNRSASQILPSPKIKFKKEIHDDQIVPKKLLSPKK